MRIALNGWFWDQPGTGSGQVLHGLVRWLPRVSDDDRWLIVPSRIAIAAEPAGWRVLRLDTPFDRRWPNLAKVWFEQIAFPLACRRIGAQVAHIPYWGSPWWRPCKIVVTVHDLIPLLLPEYRGGPLQRVYTALVARTARRAHLLLTDSDASRQDILAHLRVEPDRVRTVPLAVDEAVRVPVTAEDVDRVRSRYNLPPRYLLYFGGFDVRKNVPRLLEAYARLVQAGRHRGVPLVIAGRLPREDTSFTPDPVRIARELGVEQWVYFTGWVADEDKAALYALAEALVFVPTYEGFGLPALEAMSVCRAQEGPSLKQEDQG